MSMTTTKTKPITKATVQAELRRIRRENPDTVNPYRENSWGDKTCLYHQGRGRNIRRCLIGQLGFNLGLPTPRADFGNVTDLVEDEPEFEGPWAGRFTQAAVEYMTDVQYQADGYGPDPLPWGQVKL